MLSSWSDLLIMKTYCSFIDWWWNQMPGLMPWALFFFFSISTLFCLNFSRLPDVVFWNTLYIIQPAETPTVSIDPSLMLPSRPYPDMLPMNLQSAYFLPLIHTQKKHKFDPLNPNLCAVQNQVLHVMNFP